MEAEATRVRQVPPAFWGLLFLVGFLATGGFASPSDLFWLPTLGAALGGATARRSPALGGAALGLGLVALVLLLVSASGGEELRDVWPIAAYELIVGAGFAALGWTAARPGRTRGELIALLVIALAAGAVAGLIGFVGLFVLACSPNGC